MISAVVLTKNEYLTIEECLKSLLWCDEIVVIDDGSTDDTPELVKKSGAKFIVHRLDNDFAKQRNFGLSKAKGEWVLFVDADEKVTDELASEIKKATQDNKFDGFYVRRVDHLWRKKMQHGEAGEGMFLRLANKNKGKWVGAVHERWEINGRIGELKNPLLHYPHRSLTYFLQKINYYTDLRAGELYQQKIRVHWWDIIAYPAGKFITNYFLKKGYLDGTPGMIHALIMSFHSFLVRAKLWQLWSAK